ncbi:MAG: hypothetical protein GY696_35945, partial [Gammaproteobacteria bacterium]|nr:hypothetical protein [Gammaproteobacteria bacterium]
MARHKIHDLTWSHGESLVQLATRIRNLHFHAHSQAPLEEREAYARDTFCRLLPQGWRLRIRDKNLSTLSEYLTAAIECEGRDQEARQSASAPFHADHLPPSGSRVVTCHPDHGIRSVGQSSPPKDLIADSVYYPLEVEGVPTPARALMDSGATLSIVSLEFVKKIAAVGDPRELLSRCQGLNARFDGYGGKPLMDLPLRVKCHSSAEFTLFCAVDEGEHPEAEFLLGKGGMRDLGFKLLSPDREDLLASTGGDSYSVLGSQPGALVACVSNVTDEVSPPRQALEDQSAMECQTARWEVGDQVVI